MAKDVHWAPKCFMSKKKNSLSKVEIQFLVGFANQESNAFAPKIEIGMHSSQMCFASPKLAETIQFGLCTSLNKHT